MSEKKLAEIMSKDKDLVRRVSDIEVEEVTLTKKGALGDEADAVILYKEEDEKQDEVKEDEVADLEKEAVTEDTTEEAAEEVVELEKEEVAEDATDGNIEMDFDSAISFIQKGELTDEQKQSVLDTALVMFDAADLEKEQPAPEVSAFPEEAMDLLKSIHGLLEKELPEQFKNKKKSDEDSEEDDSEDKEDKKPEFLKKEVDVLGDVDRLLREADEAKLEKQRSEQEAAINSKLDELSSVLSGLAEKHTETQRRLARECGIDA